MIILPGTICSARDNNDRDNSARRNSARDNHASYNSVRDNSASDNSAGTMRPIAPPPVTSLEKELFLLKQGEKEKV